jgi:hypothetical protein
MQARVYQACGQIQSPIYVVLPGLARSVAFIARRSKEGHSTFREPKRVKKPYQGTRVIGSCFLYSSRSAVRDFCYNGA